MIDWIKNINKDYPEFWKNYLTKFETRPNRKMGHITIINEDIDLAKRIAKEIKETVIITTKK